MLRRLRRVAGHSTLTALSPVPLVHSTAKCARVGFRDSLCMFFAYTKILGRTEKRTRARMYCQTIRTVRDISRDDRARIATCSLRTPTGRIIVYLGFGTDRFSGHAWTVTSSHHRPSRVDCHIVTSQAVTSGLSHRHITGGHAWTATSSHHRRSRVDCHIVTSQAVTRGLSQRHTTGRHAWTVTSSHHRRSRVDCHIVTSQAVTRGLSQRHTTGRHAWTVTSSHHRPSRVDCHNVTPQAVMRGLSHSNIRASKARFEHRLVSYLNQWITFSDRCSPSIETIFYITKNASFETDFMTQQSNLVNTIFARSCVIV